MRLSLFQVSDNFSDFLRQVDSKVPFTHLSKSKRPFVGILFTIDNHDYFAPLSSPKPKHSSIKNDIDFIKINQGIWGVINLNNMIPVHSSCLIKINLQINKSDSIDEKKYKILLSNQLTWCNSNRALIIKRATKLYFMIINKKARPELTSRCCDFLQLNTQYQNYCNLINIK
jgi:protein AbiQ